ncbi:AIR synthase-related protein [Syncephalis plumigaleata]|nr:AIR synthase-related protein [Syncephalis plumigaleata]
MGKIACANVLSDLYAVGAVQCDTMLMLLGVSTQLTDPDVRKTATALCMRGFKDLAATAGTRVTGGQTVRNPWYVIGGVATAVIAETKLIRPVNAQPGDVLILTKPLGTQPAVMAYGYLADEVKRQRLHGIVSDEQVVYCYNQAVASMARLNLNAARLMHKYGKHQSVLLAYLLTCLYGVGAHAATDVTGFGLLGHASNLAAGQKSPVDFIIDTIPVLPHAMALDKVTGFGLSIGTSPETSGGLLIAIPSDMARPFLNELLELDGWPGCIVGNVIEGTGKARLLEADQLTIKTIEHAL